MKSSETPYSVAFPYMVTSSRIVPVVVILLVFIILHPVNSSAHARALDISSSFESTTYLVMPPKGKLSRKRATREGHRTTVKRIAYEVNEQLDTATVDVLDEYKQAPALHVSKLRQKRESLRAKLGTLKALDEEILSNVEEEEIEDEIREADLVNELIQLTITRIEDFLEASRPPAKSVDAPKHKTPVSPSVSADSSDVKPSSDSVESPVRLNVSTEVVPGNFEPSNHSVQLPNSNPASSSSIQETSPRVKLPKLDMKKFDGEVSTWPTFWDAFESSIHKNPKLAPIDKFNYLNSLLMKPALDAISGLSLTASNYEEAIAILKKRFGNKQQIINRHMDILVNVSPVINEDTRKLRELYDTLESHVRSLKSLGLPSGSYGSLLSSIIMSKLPQELRLIISREIKDQEWQLDTIMRVLESELEARERAVCHDESLLSAEGQAFPTFKMRTTTSALFTKHSGPTCTYCKQSHPSNSCKMVTNPAARKDILIKQGRCFVCLRKDHLSKNCPSKHECFKCKGKHHISICPSSGNNSTNSRTTPRQEHPQKQSGNYCPSGSNESGPNSGINSSRATPTQEEVQNRSRNSKQNLAALYVSASTPVLLQTANALTFKPGNSATKAKARLILDSGSQRTYVSARLRDHLNLPAESSQRISIKTFGSTKENVQCVDVVRLCVATDQGEGVELSAFVVPIICDPLQSQYIAEATHSYAHLTGLKLADYGTGEDSVEVDILVGSDQYWSLVSGRVVRGEHGPIAIETKLGWVLSGPIPEEIQVNRQQSNLVATHVLKSAVNPVDVTDETLDGNLRTFWELESLGIKPRTLYEEFQEQISFKNNRYEVHLPWKTPHPSLPDNYELSRKRLENLLKRLRQEPEVLKEYDSVIKEQLQTGIVEVVEKPSEGEVGRVHYIPHHAVIRTDKSTTKLRVVYDASAKSDGVALNDCVYSGPPLAENIFDVLLRFRINQVALIGDVEKAFLMVGMAEEDRDVLRFLWVDDIDKFSPEIVVLRFTRVVFGVSSSPFLLNATIKHHVEQYKEADCEFVEKFLRSIYVDDLSSGASEVDAAYELYLKSKLRLAEGGFNLRKFVSNCPELTNRIQYNETRRSNIGTSSVEPGHAQSSQALLEGNAVSEEDETYAKSMLGGVDETTSVEQKVLGVRWNPSKDVFIFDLTEIANHARDLQPTKRNVVSVAAKFYDPFGFLSPVIIEFKLFFQELCKTKIGWDDPLSGNLLKIWLKLLNGLEGVTALSLPRCYFQGIQDKVVSCSLHGFGDASTKAYAAVIYLHVTTTVGGYVKLVASKSRVAPVKELTIPRLELLAALVLARLITHVKEALELDVTITNMTCWTDSRVTLFWIKGEEREWKQFVRNRVNEIRNLVPPSRWQHCNGKDNPADIPSRGLSPVELSKCPLWQEGPKWLTCFTEDTNSVFNSTHIPEECFVEMRAEEKVKCQTSSLLLAATEPCGIAQIMKAEDFSDLRRLLRVTALVLKFVRTMKSSLKKDISSQSESAAQDIMGDAEIMWIKEVQKSLSKNPKFEIWRKQFGIFTDSQGIMRCNGRLSKADLPSSIKHPVLLDKGHHITSLIVQDSHKRVMHGGVKLTLTELRARFWIVQGRQFVKKLLYKCVICRKLEGRPYRAPPSPPLPEFRVKECPPFAYTGVDFAGPLYVKNHTGPQQKVWICLYTCCVTRAIHLDLVPSLTTSAFLRSLRRFSARRGTPLLMVSDNGKTFKSAAREIKQLMNDPEVKQYFAKARMKWSFNLEKAPWWGGIFERLVRSVKRCLKKTIGGAILAYEELLTVVVEVESILNCRPLSYVSSEDPEEPLTPSHLLCGRRLMSLPDSNTSDSPDYDIDVQPQDLSRRMQHLSNILNHFWKRWRNEYLIELRNAHRHQSQNDASTAISIGDVVIVHEENQPRGKWRVGKVLDLIAGADSCVRGAVVEVRSKGGKSVKLKRPVQRLYPLEIQCEVPVRQVSDDCSSQNPDPVTTEVEKPVVRQSRPRRAAAVEADRRRKTWLEDLN